MVNFKKAMMAPASSGGSGYYVTELTDSGSPSNSEHTVLSFDSTGQVGFKVVKWNNYTYDNMFGVLDVNGDSVWTAAFDSAQNQEALSGGVAFDSSDRLIAGAMGDSSGYLKVFRYSTSGSLQTQSLNYGYIGNRSNTFAINNDILYAAVTRSNSGYQQGAWDISGSRFDQSNLTLGSKWSKGDGLQGKSIFPQGIAWDSTYVYNCGRIGAGSTAKIRIDALQLSGSTSGYVSKDFDVSGYSYFSQNALNGTLALDSTGKPYFTMYSYGGNYDVFLCKVDTASNAFHPSGGWGKRFSHSVNYKISDGGVCVDSSDNVYCGMIISGDTTSTSGIYIECFNSSGTFQREFKIRNTKGGSNVGLYYQFKDIEIDGNDDIYVSFHHYNGVGWTPNIMKIPADFSTIGSGSDGDWTWDYNTSSSLTINTASVGRSSAYSYWSYTPNQDLYSDTSGTHTSNPSSFSESKANM